MSQQAAPPASTILLTAILAFAVITIVLLCLLQRARFKRGGLWSTNFIVLVGITIISSLATVLAISGAPAQVQTAVFTLFGTLAGYLATRKVTDGPTQADVPGDGGGGGDGGGDSGGTPDPVTQRVDPANPGSAPTATQTTKVAQE